MRSPKVDDCDVVVESVQFSKLLLKPFRILFWILEAVSVSSTTKIVWRNVALFTLLHVGAIHGAYLFLSFQLRPITVAWGLFVFFLNWMGITVSVHRLWAHRTYKAKLPLRIFFMLCNSVAMQNHIYEWSRDHRSHHKFSETDADPHNAKRGFFFAHMGWLLCRKHPDVINKGQTLDMSDLDADPVVMFQKKFYVPLAILMCFVFPVTSMYYICNETWYVCLVTGGMLRLCITLHVTWLVNSAAHLWGDRPYDKNISPAENLVVTLLSSGEGYHNYHHTFPWDYSAGEWGTKWNPGTYFIELFERLGLAYDLKSASRELVQKKRQLRGDGSAPWYPKEEETNGAELKARRK